MDWSQTVITVSSVIVAITSSVASILAWVAKIRWSNEFAVAKDASIKAKDDVIQVKMAQIEILEREILNLRELNPLKLREYFLSVKNQLEEYIDSLKKQVEDARLELQAKDEQIEYLKGATLIREQIEKKTEELTNLNYQLIVINAIMKNTTEFYEKGELRSNYLYTPKPDEINAENVAEWFLENYKDPVHGVPCDEGEYVYALGGPYDAEEELYEHFPEAEEEVIKKAVEIIQAEGTIDWVKRWEY